ncbi:MAG: SHOCT domain-containing protein [Anaerolineae bacterium]|nr:SHOCT domain-containing protein [Anaerolineae bacterium]
MPIGRRRRGPVVVTRGGRPGLVGTMARTAVITGTATATHRAVSGMMSGGGGGGGGSQQAADQQQAAMEQQYMAELQAQQAAELAAQQQALAAQAAQQQALPAPAEPAGDSFDEQLIKIQKLSAMKDQGLLTEEEFQAKKRQILGI